jgi:hypothetical protein
LSEPDYTTPLEDSDATLRFVEDSLLIEKVISVKQSTKQSRFHFFASKELDDSDGTDDDYFTINDVFGDD